ncbi:unnamed protein product [Allacma fusca]|uniref:SHSP domain-containing protein n=1 Tax=Allacma fusca TaxID=39272 RepID=A0A8J2JFF6_9HEXA|nr:unnamed protein product [Allacma fusca]
MSLWGGNLPVPHFTPRSWNTLAVMEDSLRDMDRHFNRMFRDVNALLRDLPRLTPNEVLGTESEIVTEGDQKKFQMKLLLGEHFTPENVKVTMKDRLVTVEAKADLMSEDGSSRLYQEITRKFLLPEKLNMKEVKSIMGPDGILKIEAPVPPGALPEPPKPKEIPIQLE